MDLAIVCPDCLGTGVRISVTGFRSMRPDRPADEPVGEMVVPIPCACCDGSGRLMTSGWA
ncbi:hypothetical protein CLV63_105252 [Murinocardiopsis flavida]|uniref:Molecular chaperone DnaJ n=1 Tax=Murinocardiopsis flavida TaxID=645275 RepID=A0A2P8DMY3_9ACTN|nr:hypothetical protein [Murinocardiopsis flavida]PSK98578.1 hypothetical protein CLV63_105252 [Murinocardiopsis flavida]